MPNIKTVEDFMEIMSHHRAIYNGKTVIVDCPDPKQEFKFACMRIIDNGASGIVVCPDGKRYEVTQGSRKARLVS
jgi:hypothetical protein